MNRRTLHAHHFKGCLPHIGATLSRSPGVQQSRLPSTSRSNLVLLLLLMEAHLVLVMVQMAISEQVVAQMLLEVSLSACPQG